MEYLWRHPHALAQTQGTPGHARFPFLVPQNLSGYRRILLFSAVLGFLAHTLTLALFSNRPEGRYLSNFLQFFLGLIGCLAMADAGSRSERAARRIWFYAAIALGAYTAGQLIFITYDLLSRGAGYAPRISDQFFFFWVVPLLAASAIDALGQQEGFDATALLDFTQLLLLGIVLHLFVFGDASTWLNHTQQMEFLKLKVRVVRDVLVLSFLWGRAWLTHSRQLRGLFLRLGIFYLAYSVADAVYLYIEAVRDIDPGTWFDMLWSLPRLLAVLLALSWKWRPDAEPDRLSPARGSQACLRVLPVVGPIAILGISFRAFSAAPVLWGSLIAGSFIVASIRLLLMQSRQGKMLSDLNQSNELLHSIIEGTSEAIYLKDHEGRYKLINSAGARYMGFSPEQVLGKTDRELLSPETIGAIVKTDKQVLTQGLPVTCEEQLIEGGATRTFLSTKNPYRDAEGKVVGVLGISVEITEHRRMEEQLRRSQRMESIGTFSGAIAHDFSNLLTVIKGYGQLTIGEVADKPELHGNLEQILKATDRAAALIRQLLAFSRQQVLQPRVICLNDVISHLQKMLQRLIGEDIQIATSFIPDLWAIKADPGQIEQVLMNLAANARDAMPKGGKLSFETQNLRVDDGYARSTVNMDPGEYVMLAVTDSGVGIDEKTQARIFEPFFTTKPAGTGLGLATVYGIVKQSGGFIWVESSPGAGTTFKIYLPRVEQPVDYRMDPLTFPNLNQNHHTVLLVEDDDQVRELACKALQKAGYTVLNAGNAEEAQGLAARHEGPIHLLLTDVVLPGTYGGEMARRITQQRGETRVLYMSGYSGDAILYHGVPPAASNVLQKPFTPDFLLERVRKVLQSAAPA
jgi:PAS domain S-box-containing protein